MKTLYLTVATLVITSATSMAQTDDCASAPAIAGAGMFAFTTIGMTTSGTPASCANMGISNDGWFSWTSDPAPTTYRFSTCGASFDTVLAAWDACGGVELACSDLGCGLFSQFDLTVPASTTYLLQIDGWTGAQGTGTLTIAPVVAPANDDCSGATPLALGPNAVSTAFGSASGVQATVGTPWVDNLTPDTDCQDFGNGFDVLNIDTWHTFTPTSSGEWRFSACNTASYDTKLAIYSGACGAPTALACNDDGDGCMAFSSELRATLTSGTDYLVQVGAFGAGIEGTATLDVFSAGGPPALGTNVCMTAPNSNDPVGAVMSASGSTSAMANNLVLTATGGSIGQPGIMYYGTVELAGISFGEGFRCAGGTTVRLLPPIVSDGTGTFTKIVDYTVGAIPAAGAASVMAGNSHTYQCWFRDPDCVGATTGLMGDCNDDGAATGFTLSDGYTIVYTP